MSRAPKSVLVSAADYQKELVLLHGDEEQKAEAERAPGTNLFTAAAQDVALLVRVADLSTVMSI